MRPKKPLPFIEKLYSSGILKDAVTSPKDGSAGGEHPSGFFLAQAVATGGYVGYAPFAQGTFGSLLVVAAYYIVYGVFSFNFVTVSLAVVILAAVLYFAGVWASGVCEKVWGHDPGRVVIDEIVGMLVTLAFVPLSGATVWLGFFLFRVFDIFKPPPVRTVEICRGGWGVMNDDVMAGIYANISLRIILAALNMQ